MVNILIYTSHEYVKMVYYYYLEFKPSRILKSNPMVRFEMQTQKFGDRCQCHNSYWFEKVKQFGLPFSIILLVNGQFLFFHCSISTPTLWLLNHSLSFFISINLFFHLWIFIVSHAILCSSFNYINFLSCFSFKVCFSSFSFKTILPLQLCVSIY